MRQVLFVTLALAVSAHSNALSTSAVDQTSELTVGHSTAAHSEGKRMLRANDRMPETLNEERIEKSPVELKSLFPGGVRSKMSAEEYHRTREVLEKASAKLQKLLDRTPTEKLKELHANLLKEKNLEGMSMTLDRAVAYDDDLRALLDSVRVKKQLDDTNGNLYKLAKSLIESLPTQALIQKWKIDPKKVIDKTKFLFDPTSPSMDAMIRNFYMALGSEFFEQLYPLYRSSRLKRKKGVSHASSMDRVLEMLRMNKKNFEAIGSDPAQVEKMVRLLYQNENLKLDDWMIYEMVYGSEFLKSYSSEHFIYDMLEKL